MLKYKKPNEMKKKFQTKNMEAVLKLIEQDIETLEEGFKNNMCDAAEVQKAKDMLAEAKQKMANLPNRPSTLEEHPLASINMLI